MPDIIANHNQNKTQENVSIFYGTHYMYSAFFANDNFSTNMVSFLWIVVPFMASSGMSYAIMHFIYTIEQIGEYMNQQRTDTLTKQNKVEQTVCISYGMYCVCSTRSRRSLLLTWCPFDVSPLTKPFIAWATILEPYHLVKSRQVIWN